MALLEGSILLGLDYHDEDYIKKLGIFYWKSIWIWRNSLCSLLSLILGLLTICIMRKRIFSYDWKNYTCGKVVFQPKLLSSGRIAVALLLRLG